jgi:hypothetical protein
MQRSAFTFALQPSHRRLTAFGNDSVDVMRLRILLVTIAIAFLSAGAALAADPTAGLPPGWSHAEINVILNGKPHTLIFDRGKVMSVDASTLTLKERDGSIVAIPVGPRTVVRVDGRLGSLSLVQPGFSALTRRVDGGPAKLVRATRPLRKQLFRLPAARA